MKKETALYRFVYMLALLATVVAIYGTGLFGLYYGLAHLALSATADPPAAVVSAVYAALFIALAAMALLFTALFNLKTLTSRIQEKSIARHAGKPWYAWATVAAAAAALLLVLRYSLPGIDFLDESQARMGLVFLFLPFLWEYVLGLNTQYVHTPVVTPAKPLVSHPGIATRI